jgi:hypothetical protein
MIGMPITSAATSMSRTAIPRAADTAADHVLGEQREQRHDREYQQIAPYRAIETRIPMIWTGCVVMTPDAL